MRRKAVLCVITSLLLASLACNAAAAEDPNSDATVQAVFITITAQAEAANNNNGTQDETATPEPSEETVQPGSTSQPTPTLIPSPTPPSERSGSGTNLNIPACTQPITVDAHANEWVSMSGALRFPLNHNTHGADQWTGEDDLSGYARLCWTGSALFVFVEVFDDVHVQTESGETAWKGDEVEFLFDADLSGDYYDEIWDSDDRQIGLSPGNFSDLPPSVTRFHPGILTLSALEVAARPTTGGYYLLEAQLPWTILGVDPQPESIFGLCIALSDNDDPNNAVQQSMVSHCPDLYVVNPTTWVSVTLKP